jgi:hypothetical protein
VHGSRNAGLGPSFAADGSGLYLDTSREFESRLARHLHLPKPIMGPHGALWLLL